MFFVYGVAAIVFLVIIFIGFQTLRFWKDKKLESVLWRGEIPKRLKEVGVVKNLTILPLIDYYTDNQELMVEPGVSYLICADNTKILFDVGFNKAGEHPSPLLHNMEKLGIKLNDIDFIYISHRHRDHIGGTKNERKNTFSLSGLEPDLQSKKAFVPVKMHHPSAEVEVTLGPKKLAEGIVSIGAINSALWLMGMTAEQSLAINVEGKGIVLILGCGHQKIERVIKRAEDLFDMPVYGIIGGLHYPVTLSRLPFNMQRMFSTGKLPWQRITKNDVEKSLSFLKRKQPAIIGLSAHDSCDWTLNLFKQSFGNNFREVLVGTEIMV